MKIRAHFPESVDAEKFAVLPDKGSRLIRAAPELSVFVGKAPQPKKLAAAGVKNQRVAAGDSI